VNEFVRLREQVNDIFVRHTGRERAIIERDTDRDYFLNAVQAVEYGLIDSVLTIHKENGHAAPSAN
jgi:ATP-dependent Clp protease protease subunit